MFLAFYGIVISMVIGSFCFYHLYLVSCVSHLLLLSYSQAVPNLTFHTILNARQDKPNDARVSIALPPPALHPPAPGQRRLA